MTKTLTVKLVHSPICCPPRQRATLRGLGLAKLQSERTLVDTKAVRGMITSVSHLVRIVEEGTKGGKAS